MVKKDINMVNFDDFKGLRKVDNNKANDILRYIEDHEITNMNELKNVNGVNDDMINELSMRFSAGAVQEA